MTSGKTIIYTVMSAVGVSLIPAAESYSCRCPGGPRGAKLHSGKHDEPHRDNLQGD
jgi:hypothetical protein